MPLDPHAVHRSGLRPLPMKITHAQYDRLKAARARDGLSIQEHVRRALDLYFAPPQVIVEGQAGALQLPTPTSASTPPAGRPSRARPKLRTR